MYCMIVGTILLAILFENFEKLIPVKRKNCSCMYEKKEL